MNQLTVLEFKGKKINMQVDDAGTPWWDASEVCEILGHSNVSMAVKSLDDDEKGLSNADTLGGRQEKVFINESGLYSLVLGSRKPEAKSFKRWVTSEVLPSIRKTGAYSSQPMSAADILMLQAKAMKDIELKHQAQAKQIAAVETKIDEFNSTTKTRLDQIEQKLVVDEINQFPRDCMRLETIANEFFPGLSDAVVVTWLKIINHPSKIYRYTDDKGKLYEVAVFVKKGLIEARERFARESAFVKTAPKTHIFTHPQLMSTFRINKENYHLRHWMPVPGVNQ